MAIKRTISRQNFVTNTSIPDMGGQALADATQYVAKTINNISQNVDKRQLETAIIEAEKQGQMIGQREDEKGNLIPLDLVTLNSFNPDMFSKRNQEIAKARYREKAIDSYGLALQNDAIDTAGNSYLNHGGKVDENGKLLVVTDKEGYLSGIKDKVSKEVWSAISPNLDRIWNGVHRKASAVLLENVRSKNYINGVKSLDFLVTEEINLTSNGINARQLDESKAKAFSLIEDNAKNAGQAESVKLAYSNKLQSGVAENAVRLAHASDTSVADLYEMAQVTRNNFNKDTTVDGDVVYNAMIKEITRLETIKRNDKIAVNQVSSNKTDTLINNLIVNGVQPSENEIAELEIKDQLRLNTNVMAINKRITTEAKVKFNNQVQRKILDFANKNYDPVQQTDMVNEFTDSSAILTTKRNEDKLAEIMDFLGNKDLSPSNYNNILKSSAKYQTGILALSLENMSLQLEQALSGDGPILYTPNQLRSDLFISQLRAKGFIGDQKGNKYKISAWFKKVDAYEAKFIKANKKAKLISEASSYTKEGIPWNNDHRKALEDEIATSFDYNGVDTNFNILSDDQNISNKSMEHYVALAMSQTYVPRPLSDILNNVRGLDDDAFMKTKQVYGALKKAFISKHGSDYEAQFSDFAVRNNLNQVQLDSMMMYNDASKFANSFNSQSTDRSLSQIFNREESDSFILAEKLKQIGNKGDDHFVTQFFNSDLVGNPDVKNTLRKFFTQNNVSDMSDLYIKDPTLNNMLMREVKAQIRMGNFNTDSKDQSFEAIVSKAIYDFSSKLSLQEDANGNAVMTLGVPILKYAQASVTVDDMVITLDDIKEDFRYNYNESFGGGDQDPEVQKAIENGKLMFVSNNEPAGEPSYRVVALTEDGRALTLNNNYQYDFSGSLKDQDYQNAIGKINNGGIRKILSSFDLMSKSNLNAVMESMKSNRQSAEKWDKIINIYNNIAGTVKVSRNNILPYIETNKKELEEYFDKKRFFRLDIR